MTDIKDIAAQQATERTLKQPPPPQQAEQQFTTYDELLAKHKTGIVRTSSGETYEIQRIPPGDIFLSTGSPIIKAISESGIDITDEAEVKKVIENISSQEALDFVTDDDFIEQLKKIVIRGVTSITFVDKKQKKCNQSKKEISIDLLSGPDIIDICVAIQNLSVSEGDAAEIQLFRQDGESDGEQGEHNTDISNGAEVQSETEPTAVSSEE